MHMQELPKHVSAIIDVMVDCCNIAACNEIADHLKGIIFQEVEQIAGEVAVYQQLNRESHHVLLSETFLQFKTCSNAIPIDKWGKYELLHFYKDAMCQSFHEHGYVFLPSMPDSREPPPRKTLFVCL